MIADLTDMLTGCLIMFAVTYATKAVTLLFIKKDIKSKYIRSFLYYLPYSVLAVMVFPTILFCTSSIWSGLAGTAAALLLSFFRKGLLPVSLAAIGTVFVTELLMYFL